MSHCKHTVPVSGHDIHTHTHSHTHTHTLVTIASWRTCRQATHPCHGLFYCSSDIWSQACYALSHKKKTSINWNWNVGHSLTPFNSMSSAKPLCCVALWKPVDYCERWTSEIRAGFYVFFSIYSSNEYGVTGDRRQ
jgi:hypothetical protein